MSAKNNNKLNHEMKNNECQYLWKIPSIHGYDAELLCFGYIRLYCDNNNLYIIKPIIKLFELYYCSDSYTFNDICLSSYLDSFYSKIISIYSFKWYLQIYPFGCNENTKSKVVLFLKIASVAKQYKQISGSCKLAVFKPYNIQIERNFIFNEKNLSSGWILNDLDFKKISLSVLSPKSSKKNTDQIIIGLTINDLKVNGKPYINNNNNNTKIVELPTAKFKWSITDKIIVNSIKCVKNNESFSSPIFKYGKFKWRLMFFPNSKGQNDAVLYVNLMNLPNGISQVSTRLKLQLQETSTIYNSFNSTFKDSVDIIGWAKGTLVTEQLKNLETLTFYLDLTIHEVYDDNDDKGVIPFYAENFHFKNIKLKQLPIGKYKWTINDVNLLSEIKFAPPSKRFLSTIFGFGIFKWCLSFEPNDKGKGNTGLYLRLITFTNDISKVMVQYRLILRETKTMFAITNSAFGEINSLKGWPRSSLPTNKLLSLKSLTFEVQFTVHEVYDKYGELITNYEEKYGLSYIAKKHNLSLNISKSPIIKLNELPTSTYWWKISDQYELNKIRKSKNAMPFNSKLISIGPFIWYMILYPNGINKRTLGKLWLGLKLLYFPPKLNKTTFKYTIKFHEMNKIMTAVKIMKITDESLLYGMRTNVTIQELDKLNKLTFSAKVTIIDLFDNNNKIIKNHKNYINNYIFKKLDKFPMSTYEWKITNKSLISKIKTSPSVCGFSSKIFEAHSLKWCIDLYPNGSFFERENSVNIFVRLLSLPSRYLKINARISIYFIELGDKYQLIKSAKFDGAIWGCPVSESFNHQLKTKITNTITIKIKIEMIDIFDNEHKNGEKITKYFVNNAQNNGNVIDKNNIFSDKYEWKISSGLLLQRMKDSVNGKQFESPIFKILDNELLKFNLILYPNGKDKKEDGLTNIGVKLISNLPSNTTIIYTRCLLSVEQLNKIVVLPLKFYNNHIVQEWNYHFGMQRLSINEFKSLKQCTIKLQIDIIDIYDKGNNITKDILLYHNDYNHIDIDDNDDNNSYYDDDEKDMICIYDGDKNKKEMDLLQDINDKLKKYDERMNAMESNVNEIKLLIKQQNVMLSQYKENKSNVNNNNDNAIASTLLNEIRSMKQIIGDSNHRKNNNNNHENDRFKYWLKNDVGLEDYYQLLVENGVDSLSTIKLLKEKELTEIGITIIGHRVKLLHEISLLNEQINDNDCK